MSSDEARGPTGRTHHASLRPAGLQPSRFHFVLDMPFHGHSRPTALAPFPGRVTLPGKSHGFASRCGSDPLRRRDPLAGRRFQPGAEPGGIVRDGLGPVTSTADLDVETPPRRRARSRGSRLREASRRKAAATILRPPARTRARSPDPSSGSERRPVRAMRGRASPRRRERPIGEKLHENLIHQHERDIYAVIERTCFRRRTGP